MVCAAESWVELSILYIIQLWVSCYLLWVQDRPEASRATIANTRGEEESSVLSHETLGAVGAPTRLRKGPRGQGAAAASRQPQEKASNL
eukprot:6477987-Amphidinium_carterae.1